MSLTTTYLQGSRHQELRDRLKYRFEKPRFDLKCELKCPPLTRNFGLIGTAFDYLMRFHLKIYNTDKIIQRDRWIADKAIDALGVWTEFWVKGAMHRGLPKEQLLDAINLYKIAGEQLQKAKDIYKKFLSDGQTTDDLLTSALFLAKLDVFHRRPHIDKTYDCHDGNDITDLRSLIALVDFSKFHVNDKCYVNPCFGEGSRLVGNADADIILDGTLIEIKTTKDLKLKRSDLNQLIGYYVLSLIGGINDDPSEKPIRNIGIYFARHGVLWTIPLSELGDDEKFKFFKEWFVEYVNRSKTRKPTLRRLPSHCRF
jgi:hypothetical protein